MLTPIIPGTLIPTVLTPTIGRPTIFPTIMQPTAFPTIVQPTFFPTIVQPTLFPTFQPTLFPTFQPTLQPLPTFFPTPTFVPITVRPGDLITADFMNALINRLQVLEARVAVLESRPPSTFPTVTFPTLTIPTATFPTATFPTLTITFPTATINTFPTATITTFPTFPTATIATFPTATIATFPTFPTATIATFPTATIATFPTFPTATIATFPTATIATFPTFPSATIATIATFPTMTIQPTGEFTVPTRGPFETIVGTIPGGFQTFNIVAAPGAAGGVPGQPTFAPTATALDPAVMAANRTTMEVAGVGGREFARLSSAGIGNLLALAVADPRSVASALEIETDAAEAFVNEARTLAGVVTEEPAPTRPARPRRARRRPEEDVPLKKVSGIGRARADQLVDAGIPTAGRLAESTPEEVSDALGVSEQSAKKIIKNARAALRS